MHGSAASRRRRAALRTEAAPTLTDTWRALRDQPLLSRIALSVVLSTATLLVLDYCFKSTVARSMPSASIGPFIARYYLALNVLSLIVQVLLGSAVVRRLGVTAAVIVTPVLLLLGAAEVVLFGGALSAVLVMKAIDGALRYSMHRISGELIYLPLPVRIRQHFKPLIDGALVRASQTLTGAGLLALSGTWATAPWLLPWGVAALAGTWLAVAVTMRKPYLALLRKAVTVGSLQGQDSPGPLDLESAQILVQHLASEDPLEVVGAMKALSRRGHEGFVPALILLHSDERVLTEALDHFGASTRTDWMVLAHRLLGDRREGVRMAAARALAMHNELDVARLADDVGSRVRGYATVVLALRDPMEDAMEDERIPHSTARSRRLGRPRATRHAGRHRRRRPDAGAVAPPFGARRFHGHIARAHRAARTGGRASARPAAIPRLVELLSAREGREAVRAALVAFGEDALQAVWWALRDTTRPHRDRIHLPKTLGRFGTRAAAEHLLDNIETEEDGLVRYKSIRALEILVTERRIPLDRARVERIARAALTRHFRLLASRVALGAAPLVQGHPGAAARLLDGLLDDKLRQSIERVFRLLAIAHPREDFRRVRLACLSDDPYTRANAGELLDALLRHRDQEQLRALLRLITEDLSLPERAARAASLGGPAIPAGAMRPSPRSCVTATRSWLALRRPARKSGPYRPPRTRRTCPRPAMPDVELERIHRELFLAAFGAHAGVTESWVTDRLTSLLEEQIAASRRDSVFCGRPARILLLPP